VDPNGAHRTRNGWSCRCPVHQGVGHTSLGFATGQDGQLIAHCFAGCGWREIDDEISAILERAAA
jgi:hypothetical protein